jgi:CheY-like chemotaxis protein
MSGKVVLLAEDEPHVAKLVDFKLGGDGFEVVHALDGGRAIALLPSRSWVLVILDVLMPVADGWEVLRAIRSSELPAIRALPVLVLSGNPEQKDPLSSLPGNPGSGIPLGPTHYLRKPFDPAELLRRVRALTGPNPGETFRDPELQALRDEFIESFPERRVALETLISKLAPGAAAPGGPPIRETLLEARFVVHKLAGIAESYGFPKLSRIFGAVDDLILRETGGQGEGIPVDRWVRMLGLLRDLLAEAIQHREDPQRLLSDPRVRELICAVGSPLSGSRS